MGAGRTEKLLRKVASRLQSEVKEIDSVSQAQLKARLRRLIHKLETSVAERCRQERAARLVANLKIRELERKLAASERNAAALSVEVLALGSTLNTLRKARS